MLQAQKLSGRAQDLGNASEAPPAASARAAQGFRRRVKPREASDPAEPQAPDVARTATGRTTTMAGASAARICQRSPARFGSQHAAAARWSRRFVF